MMKDAPYFHSSVSYFPLQEKAIIEPKGTESETKLTGGCGRFLSGVSRSGYTNTPQQNFASNCAPKSAATFHAKDFDSVTCGA